VIDSLKRTGLVSDYPASSMGGMREFLFKHALTQDVAYSTLTRTERRDLHRQVAEWVQDVARDRGVEAAELAAYHYGQALAYGEQDPAVARRASEALLTASDAAFKRADFAGARTLVDRALALDSGQDALFALVRTEYADGRWDAALATLDRIEAGLEPGDVAPLSDVLAWRSRTSWLIGRWEEALSSARAAVAVLDGLPESPQLARALARLSQIEMLKHQVEAIGRAEEAIAVARRVGDLFAEVNARINLISARANRGRAPDPAEELELVELAVEGGIYDEAFRALANLLWNAPGYLHVDEIESVMVEARQHLPSALPPMSIGPYVEVSKAAMLLVPAGRWDEADELIAATREAIAATTRLVLTGLIGGMAMRRGDLQAAEPFFEELEPMALGSEEPQRIVPMASVVLPWLLVTERVDDLRALADKVLTMVDGQWMVPITAVPIVRALAAAGEAELLRRTIDSMRPALVDVETGKLRTSLIAGEGLLALLEQRADEAVERLTAAVERERELGYAYDAACLELDLARALEAQGDGDRAAEVRARAASVLEPLGCVHPF
jgi:tetratricopeptide (TPR) repeat protein